MLTVDHRHTEDKGTNLEKYLRMNDQEKDTEIQKAVVRLQKRIQEILYVLETDSSRAAGSDSGKKKEQPPL